MPKIVIVEDAADLSALIQSELQSLAYDVHTASDGESGLMLVQAEKPDLVILDIMLPCLNGIEVLRRLRTGGFDAPILMLSARDAEADRVAGLELGADDYVVKPFSLRELGARVAALLRRHKGVAGQQSAPAAAPAALRALGCELDETSLSVKVDGQPCVLSQREFALLRLLMLSMGRVLTREWLLEQVWGRDYNGEDRAVDACVLRLRDRLGRASRISRAIEAVRGLGYRLNREADR
ncbi:MAG: response regulator transcription factor [Acidovorax sp.]|jgi:DNA-binding response OmpR family regulator